MQPSLDNILQQFFDEVIICIERELHRTWPLYDPAVNYTQDSFSIDIIPKAVDHDDYLFLAAELERIAGKFSDPKNPPQNEINLAYRQFQEVISDFKGGLPRFRESDVELIVQNTRGLVTEMKYSDGF